MRRFTQKRWKAVRFTETDPSLRVDPGEIVYVDGYDPGVVSRCLDVTCKECLLKDCLRCRAPIYDRPALLPIEDFL